MNSAHLLENVANSWQDESGSGNEPSLSTVLRRASDMPETGPVMRALLSQAADEIDRLEKLATFPSLRAVPARATPPPSATQSPKPSEEALRPQAKAPKGAQHVGAKAIKVSVAIDTESFAALVIPEGGSVSIAIGDAGHWAEFKRKAINKAIEAVRAGPSFDQMFVQVIGKLNGQRIEEAGFSVGQKGQGGMAT
jgi:hypothetical protein